MAWWSKWFGADRKSGRPRLDPPDVTAARVKEKRLADLKAWQAFKKNNIVPEKVTRGGAEKILKAHGFAKKRGDIESYFEKRFEDRKVRMWITLKTFGESEMYAPKQRLIVSASVTTFAYAEVEAEIMESDPATATLASAQQSVFEDFVLTADHITKAVEEVAAESLAIDTDAVLETFCKMDPAQPGSMGPQHLAALALAGDIETLDSYVRRRMDDDPCGFVPFITDEMIARAAKIGHRHG